MKRNLVLMAVFVGLLGITWALTESGLFERRPLFEEKLSSALKAPQSIVLPEAQLLVKDGVWLTGTGDVARAEVLDELHRSLEGIRIARVITAPPARHDFFAQGLSFQINDTYFEFGDLAPAGDSFYLGLKGHPDVFVVDLNEMGSLAVADEQNVLLQAKYQRLRDLLLYPEDRWRDERLLMLVRMASFERWSKESLVLDAAELSRRSWGKAVMQAFLAGLQSLKVQGHVLTQKPQGTLGIAAWQFSMTEGDKRTWEFYPHPVPELMYVWVEELGKAYPLDEASSALLRTFPERLIDRPFSMTLSEGSPQFTVEGAKSKTVSDFMLRPQTFNHLTLLSPQDCALLENSARFKVKSGVSQFAWRRVSGGWAVLECAVGLAWSWEVPLDSPMDFANLTDK